MHNFADRVVVSTAQMQAIEARLFAAGMPVAALMEKVAGRISDWLVRHYDRDRWPLVGILVGPGHNGGVEPNRRCVWGCGNWLAAKSQLSLT